MKKSELFYCIVVCLTLFLSKDFFTSSWFNDFYVTHRFWMPVILSALVTLLVACVLLLIKCVVKLRKYNKQEG